MADGLTFGEVGRLTYDAPQVPSLAWVGDDLVDVAGGWQRFLPDGTVTQPQIVYAFSFDKAVGAPEGGYAVLYSSLGTKGLVLKDGRLVREINRSYYCADSYEYPVALGRLQDGRRILVHCPDDYNRIEIEELDSGRRLTRRGPSEAADFFHSRLQISPDGRYLLSAGWVWHPWSTLMVFDLAEAIREPRSLDGRGVLEGYQVTNAEVEAAVFLDDDHILITTSFDEEVLDEDTGDTPLKPREMGIWSLRENTWAARAPLAERSGTLMSVGGPFVGFYEHPRLFRPDGGVVMRWEDLSTGRQTSSIVLDVTKNAVPPLALDPLRRRFAVAGPDSVTVVTLGEAR